MSTGQQSEPGSSASLAWLYTHAFQLAAAGQDEQSARVLAAAERLTGVEERRLQERDLTTADLRFQELGERVESLTVTQAAFQAQLRSTAISYTAVAEEAMKTAAWQTPAHLPDPLQQHVPPTGEFIRQLETTLRGVRGLCRDWVPQLARLELNARQRDVVANGGSHERGPRDGAPSYSEGDIGPTRFQSVGGENAVQLAAGFLFRILADAGMTTQAWRDTSRSGVTDRDEQPDYSSYAYLPRLCYSLVVLLEVKASLQDGRKGAVGQLITHLRHALAEQPHRRFMVGLALSGDTVEAVWVERKYRGELSFHHQGPVPFALTADSPGLRLFLQVVTASPEAAGYAPVPPDITCIRFPGREVIGEYTVLKYQTTDPQTALSPRGTRVFAVHMQDEGGLVHKTIVKLAPASLVRKEVRNLERLRQCRSIVDLVDSGPTSPDATGPGFSYLLVRPVGERLRSDMDVVELAEVLGKLADAVEDLYRNYQTLHRDLSLNNVGIGPDGGILLWDLATAVQEPAYAAVPGQLTGTAFTMAISVQLGKPATLSSELEAVLYLLIQLTSAKPHWRNSLPHSCDARWTAMTNAHIYETKVLRRIEERYHPLVNHVHDLFFPRGPTSTPLSYVYRTDVEPAEVYPEHVSPRKVRMLIFLEQIGATWTLFRRQVQACSAEEAAAIAAVEEAMDEEG